MFQASYAELLLSAKHFFTSQNADCLTVLSYMCFKTFTCQQKTKAFIDLLSVDV